VESYGYGGWGIYTDEGSTAILIENNIIYRTKTGGFHQHYGKENVLRNNIFAFSRTDQIQRTRAEPHLSFTFERNIVYWTEGPLLGKNWKDDQFRMDLNCYWNASGQPVTFAGSSLGEWRKRGHDVHSIVADPLFVDAERGDFRLKPQSPAFKLGFQPIDTSGVGPRVPLP
jgi:parallel beta-helix repeat protein